MRGPKFCDTGRCHASQNFPPRVAAKCADQNFVTRDAVVRHKIGLRTHWLKNKACQTHMGQHKTCQPQAKPRHKKKLSQGPAVSVRGQCPVSRNPGLGRPFHMQTVLEEAWLANAGCSMNFVMQASVPAHKTAL